MAIDNLMGETVRIRRGWHGGRTGEVVAFDHQVGPNTSYTAIKVKLQGNGQLVMVYSLDELQRITVPPAAPAATPAPELLEVV